MRPVSAAGKGVAEEDFGWREDEESREVDEAKGIDEVERQGTDARNGARRGWAEQVTTDSNMSVNATSIVTLVQFESAVEKCGKGEDDGQKPGATKNEGVTNDAGRASPSPTGRDDGWSVTKPKGRKVLHL